MAGGGVGIRHSLVHGGSSDFSDSRENLIYAVEDREVAYVALLIHRTSFDPSHGTVAEITNLVRPLVSHIKGRVGEP